MSAEESHFLEPMPFDPNLEIVALYFESQVVGLVTTPEQKPDILPADAALAADYLLGVVTDIRRGEATPKALAMLRRRAVFDPEAFTLMKTLDPEAEPAYPDLDATGKRIIVGNRYRYTPPKDSQGNAPGYHVEGSVTRVKESMVYAFWERVGEPNPAHWEQRQRQAHLEALESDEHVDEILGEAVQGRQETWFFAKMLHPLEGVVN